MSSSVYCLDTVRVANLLKVHIPVSNMLGKRWIHNKLGLYVSEPVITRRNVSSSATKLGLDGVSVVTLIVLMVTSACTCSGSQRCWVRASFN